MNVLVLVIDHEIQMMDAWRSAVMKAAYTELSVVRNVPKLQEKTVIEIAA